MSAPNDTTRQTVRFETVPKVQPAVSGRRIPELDGVRGVAILLVLLYHFGGYRTEAMGERVLRLASGISFGWSGVDLFFVLSGFLITSILLETRESPNYFRTFYARRVLRIFPLYFGAVCVAFGVGLPIAHSFGRGLGIGFGESVWYWTYLSNWRSGVGLDVRPLTHFWSLAVEEQFYMIWPLVVLLAGEARLRRVCAGIVLAVLAGRCLLAIQAEAWDVDMRSLYRFTIWRMDGLAMGALVATVVRDGRLSAIARKHLGRIALVGACLVLVAMALTRSPRPYTTWMAGFGFTGWALLYSCLVFRVFETAGTGTRLSRWMRNGFLERLGKYSYGLYVLHYPFVLLTHAGLQALARRFGWEYGFLSALAAIGLGGGMSYAAAVLSWRWVEEPVLRWKRAFRY